MKYCDMLKIILTVDLDFLDKNIKYIKQTLQKKRKLIIWIIPNRVLKVVKTKVGTCMVRIEIQNPNPYYGLLLLFFNRWKLYKCQQINSIHDWLRNLN